MPNLLDKRQFQKKISSNSSVWSAAFQSTCTVLLQHGKTMKSNEDFGYFPVCIFASWLLVSKVWKNLFNIYYQSYSELEKGLIQNFSLIFELIEVFAFA